MNHEDGCRRDFLRVVQARTVELSARALWHIALCLGHIGDGDMPGAVWHAAEAKRLVEPEAVA